MAMQYYTLVAALPELPPLAQCRQLPISRIALERRLSMLEDADREQLAVAQALYVGAQQAVVTEPDMNTVRHWQQQLAAVHCPRVQQRIALRLEWQTLLAALRYRVLGQLEPQQFYGVGRWTQHIRRHWHEPLFGLEQALPLLPTLAAPLLKGDAAEVEQRLAQWCWRDLMFHERSSGFGFAAVACFVLRFALAERHIAADGARALQRFHALGDALLAQPAVRAAMHSVLEEAPA